MFAILLISEWSVAEWRNQQNRGGRETEWAKLNRLGNTHGIIDLCQSGNSSFFSC
jgi:hypothetical protein